MDRYFASIKEGRAFLSDEDTFHLREVKRAEVGETIEVVADKKAYEATITSLKPLVIEVKANQAVSSHESVLKATLAFSLLKGGHDELVLQKATELGIQSFLPFISERTIVHLEAKEKAKREERWRKILTEAAMQSRRDVVPTLEPITSYKLLFKEEFHPLYLAYEGEAGSSHTLASLLPSLKKDDHPLFIVGPEGGFSESEVAFAKEKGALSISLGTRILRAETASIYLASVLSFYEELLK